MNDYTYHLPTIPYDAIALANRMAAATGSPRYAQLASDADYNGHYVRLYFNTYRGYWLTEFQWGERRVLARGGFESALAAALREYRRGALGTTVVAGYPGGRLVRGDRWPRESIMEVRSRLLAAGFVEGREGDLPWWTPKHDAVRDAMHSRRWFPELVGVACNLRDDATAQDWAAARAAR